MTVCGLKVVRAILRNNPLSPKDVLGFTTLAKMEKYMYDYPETVVAGYTFSSPSPGNVH